MELFLFVLYAASVYFFYLSVENDNDEPTDDSDGEFTFIDSL